MPVTRVQSQPTFTRRISIETPEHVVLELELAGFGSRVAAAMLDTLLQVGLLLLIVLVLVLGGVGAVEAGVVGGWVSAIIIVLWFAALWGYFTLFEGLGGGRTPGKRRLGIRVVMDTGHPVTFGAAAIRNLFRNASEGPPTRRRHLARHLGVERDSPGSAGLSAPRPA